MPLVFPLLAEVLSRINEMGTRLINEATTPTPSLKRAFVPDEATGGRKIVYFTHMHLSPQANKNPQAQLVWYGKKSDMAGIETVPVSEYPERPSTTGNPPAP
jgi:hypothetical protein